MHARHAHDASAGLVVFAIHACKRWLSALSRLAGRFLHAWKSLVETLKHRHIN
jgi:hypothetical protein